MSCFGPRVTSSSVAAPDPAKHVNYNLGMVLGVDDFTQEFAYLSGRDQWMARDLLGYGTACGLRVFVEEEKESKRPRVVVEPGVAVSPRGQLIHVTPAQCALLNDWIAVHKAQVLEWLGSGSLLHLYAVLCYRDCPTDAVPIPGEPCRTEDETMAPSRLADDFKLELRFKPPDQIEEDAVRDFVAWLSQIEIVDAGISLPIEDLINAIRAAAGEAGSPPALMDFMFGSPPSSLQIRRDDVCEYLRAAFRIWVTELRPRWRPDWLGGARGCERDAARDEEPRQEECVLLAELSVPLITDAITDDLLVQDINSVLINEERRPYLIDLRMLQEWLLCGSCCNRVATGGGGGGVTDHGALSGLGDDDHPQYLNNARGDLRYALINHPHALDDLSDVNTAVTANGDVLTRQGAGWISAPPTPLPPGGDARGDLLGTYPNPTVARIRGSNVSPIAPTIANQVLTWDQANSIWGPRLHALDDLSDVDTTVTANGDVLTRQGAGWISAPVTVPSVQNVVQHLPGIAKYEIVSAGVVNGSGGGRLPIYNGLKANATGAGRVTVQFDSYKNPEGNPFQYIVKVLLVGTDQVKAPIVTFNKFQANGFVLAVSDGGTPIAIALLQQLEFMIEVSRFE